MKEPYEDKIQDLKNPTYEQLMEGAKRHLKLTYTLTQEIDGLELTENGSSKIVFVQNELGQANIIAENGKLRNGVSNVVIYDWFSDITTEGNK